MKNRKLTQLLKFFKTTKFKTVSFNWHSNFRDKIFIFYLIPAIGLEWDVQGKPIAEDGKIVIEGYKELTVFIEWLWFFGATCFEFDWVVKNPKDFEQKHFSEAELKELREIWKKNDKL